MTLKRRDLLFSSLTAAVLSACGHQKSLPIFDALPSSNDNYHSIRKSWFDFDRAQFENYQKRRGNLNDEIEACRLKPEMFSQRFQAWVRLIDTVKLFKDDALKLTVVNGFINILINYDEPKSKKGKSLPPTYPWLQTPRTTLDTGKGVCCDIALLKYEALVRCGFNDDQIFYTTLRPVKPQLIPGEIKADVSPTPHAVVNVHLKGDTAFLNNTETHKLSWLRMLLGKKYSAARHQEFYNVAYLSSSTDITTSNIDKSGRPAELVDWPFAYINDRQAYYYRDPLSMVRRTVPAILENFDLEEAVRKSLPRSTAAQINNLADEAYRLNSALDHVKPLPKNHRFPHQQFG